MSFIDPQVSHSQGKVSEKLKKFKVRENSFITERLLMGCKESKQTGKFKTLGKVREFYNY